MPSEANEVERRTHLVELNHVTKAFGPTLANAGIDFAVGRSDVVGLVGGNGAGKSTLMRILCGMTPPSLGRISFEGVEDSFVSYDASAAQRRSIRMVHQELSLCATLSVAENFFIEAPEHARARPGWRGFYRHAARSALDAVFPGNAADVDSRIDRLSIGERQMVEIARATATPEVRLIVLDEPMSSLDLERSQQLRNYVRERARSGLAFIFISHKLHEIVDVASRIVVLRNGRVAWQGAVSESSVDRLVELMGGDATAVHHKVERAASAKHEVVRVGGAFVGDSPVLGLRRGEIIGLAGLEGHGQKDLLRANLGGRRRVPGWRCPRAAGELRVGRQAERAHISTLERPREHRNRPRGRALAAESRVRSSGARRCSARGRTASNSIRAASRPASSCSAGATSRRRSCRVRSRR